MHEASRARRPTQAKSDSTDTPASSIKNPIAGGIEQRLDLGHHDDDRAASLGTGQGDGTADSSTGY